MVDIKKLCEEIKDNIEKNETKLDKATTEVTEIKVALLGYNGTSGLLGKVNAVEKDHNALKLEFYALVGVLIGSGTLVGWHFGWI